MPGAPEPPPRPLPLAGIRVLDFSRLLPGPFATRMLAEFGAEVTKIEQPGHGDPSRHNPPMLDGATSTYFNAVNASKRAITLDLSRPAGQEVARRLAARSDVLVESFRAGVADRLGIGYAALRAINPRLIHCAISGFGQTGPLSHIAGHDLVVQGMAGVLGVALDQANPPPPPSFLAADFAAALYAVIGIQAALAQRARTGEGCAIDLAMFDALFNMGGITLATALAGLAGQGGQPGMKVYGGNPRYDTYLSRDGKPVAVSLLETRAFAALCREMGREDLIPADESLTDRHSAHGERGEAYRAALRDWCGAHDWAELMTALERTGIAVCPICTPEEALALPHVAARGLVRVEDGVPHLVNPFAGAGLATGTHTAAPALGKDTEAVLSELNFTAEEIGVLRRNAVI